MSWLLTTTSLASGSTALILARSAPARASFLPSLKHTCSGPLHLLRLQPEDALLPDALVAFAPSFHSDYCSVVSLLESSVSCPLVGLILFLALTAT